MRAWATLAALAWLTVLSGCSLPTLRWPSATAMPSSPGAEAGAPSLPWGTPPAAAAAAAAATAPTATPVNDPAYRIGPEDGLEISVWKDETLKTTALVRPDGGISFPLVGDLQVAGKTATEVRAELVSRLTRFVPDAEVTVSVVRVASYRVYVIGRVNKPGDFVAGRPIDVLQALTLAGGMTPFAVEDEIRIIRREGGRQVSIPFDYRQLRKGGVLTQNILLRSGDVVLVP
jgi:polysaccharide export outer membrane protein